MSTRTAALLVILVAAFLAVGVGLLITHVLAPAVSAGIVVGGM